MSKETETNNRKCEVCHKDDLPCMVHSSGLGGMSFNYCLVCSGIGAELKSLDTGYNFVHYNEKEDKYYKGLKFLKIFTKTDVFNTRDEYVRHFNHDKAN